MTTLPIFSFFFFNDTATTEIYTLSLHDALPISTKTQAGSPLRRTAFRLAAVTVNWMFASDALLSSSHCRDRKSTRLNSSHSQISYAVFCLKKKKKKKNTTKYD